MRRIFELHEIHMISKRTIVIWAARVCTKSKIAELLSTLGRGSTQISGLYSLGLMNQARRPQVQVLHVLAEVIKLTKDALASLCSSTAWMRGRIVI
jgi:hypothetical protein